MRCCVRAVTAVLVRPALVRADFQDVRSAMVVGHWPGGAATLLRPDSPLRRDLRGSPIQITLSRLRCARSCATLPSS